MRENPYIVRRIKIYSSIAAIIECPGNLDSRSSVVPIDPTPYTTRHSEVMASTTVPSQAHMIAPEIPTSDVTESKIPLPVADGPSSDTLVEEDPEKQTTPDSTGSTSGAEEAEDVQQYPPARRVILIMLSLYLVMFLIALVSVAKRRRMIALLPARKCLEDVYAAVADLLAGPNNNCDGYPVYDERVQLLRGCRLVRKPAILTFGTLVNTP